MKKLITLLLFAAMTATTLYGQTDVPADFSSVCSSGQVIYYKVIDYGEVNVWYNGDYTDILGGHVVIPRSVKHDGQNYVVTGIADGAFANCIRIQGMELPTTMFFIGERAFYRCTDLRTILMPKTLTHIGANAFEGCTALVDVVMPHSVVELGESAFKDCSNVRHFVISHALEAIPDGAFLNCSSVTDYLIPASIVYIGCHAFDGYKKLKSVTFLGEIPPTPSCQPAFGREIPITVLAKNFSAYKSSGIWGQFTISTF